ncbi:hypothetical protein [Rhodoblastus sp.]|uniref:hypothetical protein n=1 Tax=Rhodoblastus sp. TaxID=1962975 RepID=UPI003F94D61D
MPSKENTYLKLEKNLFGGKLNFERSVMIIAAPAKVAAAVDSDKADYGTAGGGATSADCSR